MPRRDGGDGGRRPWGRRPPFARGKTPGRETWAERATAGGQVMDEEPQQTEQELGEPAADAESPGGGGETGERQVAEPPAPHETRLSRRRFLVIVGAVVACLIGALEV